jgi:hypothetical protein
MILQQRPIRVKGTSKYFTYDPGNSVVISYKSTYLKLVKGYMPGDYSLYVYRVDMMDWLLVSFRVRPINDLATTAADIDQRLTDGDLELLIPIKDRLHRSYKSRF